MSLDKTFGDLEPINDVRLNEISDKMFEDLDLEQIDNVELKEISDEFTYEELMNITNPDEHLILTCTNGNILKSNNFNIIYKDNILMNINIEGLYKFSKLLIEYMILHGSLNDINKKYAEELLNKIPLESKKILLNKYYNLNKIKLFNSIK